VGGNQRHTFGLIVESWGDVLRRIRKYTGANWTINQCIIMQSIFRDHLNDVECTVRDLTEDEDMPQQTVSNIVAFLRAEGMVLEKTHPDDGRVKLLHPTPLALERRDRVWSEAIGFNPFAAK
jgi:DNA-binding MarR family transcriptional regulator